MRSHLAARNAYRRCLLHGSPDAFPPSTATLTASFPPPLSRRGSFSTLPPSPAQLSSIQRAPSADHGLQRQPRRQCEVPHLTTAKTQAHPSTSQRRTFLGAIRRSPPRQIKEQLVEPGYAVMLQFRTAIADNARPPLRAELVEAFRSFFAYKYEYGKRVNATQAHGFLRLYEYLEQGAEDEADGAATAGSADGDRDPRSLLETELSVEDLRTAWDALAKPPNGSNTHDHLALSRKLYSEIRRRLVNKAADFKRHLAVLCQYGAAQEAVDLLTKYTRPSPAAAGMKPAEPKGTRRQKELWVMVLEGLAREGREEALLQKAKAAEAAGLEYMPLFQEVMVTFFARRNNFAETRKWFEKPMLNGLLPTAQTYAELLAFSQRGGGNSSGSTPTREQVDEAAAKHNWVQATFHALCDGNPPKDRWDVIYQWAVVSLGKGVDEIRHMMETMEHHNRHRPNMAPDAATFNGLVRAAASKGDVLLAERFVQLGFAGSVISGTPAGSNSSPFAPGLDIAPDAMTYILQLDYRIDANDLSGAYASFLHLQEIDCPGEEDAPVINKYVQAMCRSADASGMGTAAATAAFARLRNVLDTVEVRQVMLEPETVAALCIVFLRHDRQYDAIDVLSVHALQFSVEERAVVREAFVQYIVGGSGGSGGRGSAITNTAGGSSSPADSASTARAWDAYSLLRQYFAETPSTSRARVMDAFFRRRRPDMACYVFGHMRGATEPSVRPTAGLYVRCLEGLGRCPDKRALHMVHNMLKMDAQVEMSTRLYNALMLAYAACGENERALEFWEEDINTSVEGPSYNSLAIVFYACEGLPFGDRPARSVWAKLQRMEIDVPAYVFDAYCGALAGQGHVQEVQTLLRGMETSVGYGPTAATLGIACNALPGQDFQAEFADWAAATYPDLWQQVKKRGCTTTINGLRRYKIQRDLRA